MPAVLNAVRNACIKFCEGTLLWTYTLDRISVEANEDEYTLTIPEAQYGTIISVDDVKYKIDGADDDQFITLDPLSKNQKDLWDSGSWPFRTSTSSSHYYVDKDKTLFLYMIPTEDSDEGLLVRVNLRPIRTTTVVQTFLYTNHYETIGKGAKADLFARKAQPWYDPNLASMYSVSFHNDINDAMAVKTSGYTKRPSQVRLRDFY